MGQGIMQTCPGLKLEVKTVFPPVIQPTPTTLPKVWGKVKLSIACQMEMQVAEATEQFSLVPNTLWGAMIPLSACLAALHLQALDYPCPQKHSVLNFLIMACLCLGTWDHMAPIESESDSGLVFNIPAAEEVSEGEAMCGGSSTLLLPHKPNPSPLNQAPN